MARKTNKEATVQLLKPSDIYDFYICDFFRNRGVNDADKKLCEDRIREIHQIYINACRERIKAEAGFLGVNDADLETFSIAQMVEKVGEMVLASFQSDDTMNNLMHGGQFNFAKAAIEAQRAAGMDMGDIDLKKFGIAEEEEVETIKKPGVNVDWFAETKKHGGRVVNDPKWHTIAEAFIAVEEASTINEITLAIDHLNDLQHNSFHILIDLQSGRMLEGRSSGAVDHNKARGTLQEILDMKAKAETPLKLLPNASKEVRDIAKSNRHLI